jgi:SGNH hydrolase-like domain, acetyltransferase AlgX
VAVKFPFCIFNSDMKLPKLSASVAYVLLTIAFVAASWLRLPYKDGAKFPEFDLHHAKAQQVGGLAPAGLWQLDYPQLQSSINRLSSIRLLREFGNSGRVAFGQRVEWIVWGGKRPLMLFPTIDLWVSRGLTPKVENDLSKAATTIAGYRQRLATEGWTLVVLPIPTKIGTHRELSNWPVLDANLLSRDPIPVDRSDEVYGYLRDQLKQDGVTVVNLEGVYRDALAANPSVLLYATNDSHWSGAGIDLAARMTAEAIASASPMRVRLPEHPTYVYIDHVGDLVKASDPKPSLTTWLRPVWIFHDRLVNGEEGRGYVYPSAPMGLVVAVGTSYTGQYTWMTNQPVGFAWQLGLHLQNVEVLNRPIAGHGSFVAFKQFWQQRHEISDEFAKQYGAGKPKVVVLEFPIRDVRGIIGADPGL